MLDSASNEVLGTVKCQGSKLSPRLYFLNAVVLLK